MARDLQSRRFGADAREGAGEGRRPPQMHATVASWLNNHAGKTKTPAPRQKPQHFCWGFWGW
jgi:hypothetical protein